MKKTLVALAAVAATGAYAQVTISGYFGGSYDQYSLNNINAARVGNSSEDRVSDQSSRIIFNVSEDLGGGLAAVGQFDLRFKVDATTRVNNDSVANAASTGTGAATNASPSIDQVSGGNNHIGLKSANWGTVKLGRQDIHYANSASLLPAGLFLAANTSPIMHRVGSNAIANWSRTPNLVWYESNRINGFQASLGLSTNPLRKSGTNEVENDMGTAQRKGGGTWVQVNYNNGPLDATFSTVDLKSDYAGGTCALTATSCAVDITGNAQDDQKGNIFVVKYNLGGGLKAGFGSSRNKTTVVATGVTTEVSANQASLAYNFSGKHNVTAVYSSRGESKASNAAAATDGSGAKLMTLAYHYDFSKRTSAGVMWSQLKNGSASTTDFFYQGNNAYGGQGAVLAGETATITSLALRHSF